MTNYEYLRSLPLEEMAEIIINLPICKYCGDLADDYKCGGVKCQEAAAEWLKSEKETG